MAKEGDRVLAVSHSDHGTLYIFGEGTYMGEMNPGDFSEDNQPVGFFAEVAKDIPNYTNPCIKLDDGSIVWGCECWWGLLEGFRKQVEQFSKVEKIDIKEQRRKYKDDQGVMV